MLKTFAYSIIAIGFSFAACANDLIGHKPARPQDNDLLIAAYTASQDTQYITQMLDAYNDAADEMLKDARRFAYLSGQFKNPKSPRPNLQKTVATAALAKYDCKTQAPSCNQFLTAASGMWALDSLSQRDQKIKTTISDFLNNHPRMKKIYEAEGATFSNYWALTAVYIVKPTELESVLTAYEELRPLDMEAVKKNLDMKPAKAPTAATP